jgi:peptidyl-prolyl cis-trans isomerase SurA
MTTARRLLTGAACLIALAAALPESPILGAAPAQAASEVRVVVNREAITSYQINQRAAFLRLRRESGNLQQKATDELVDEAIKNQEVRRRGIRIPDEAVDAAFNNFATSNKMTTQQLGQVLAQAGFSADAFKSFIRAQMGWGQAVQARMRSKQRMSEQDVVQRMLAEGGNKPTTTEYMLQQVILVVPKGERGSIGRRMTEANNLRSRFQSCQNTFQLATALRDVTVRDLGRVAAPELPTLWKADIQRLQAGRTTPAKETERGVEFIAICDARTVSDDVAAGLVFQEQDMAKLGRGAEPDKDYLDELKAKAQISRR